MLDEYLWISVLVLTLTWLFYDFISSRFFFTRHNIKFDLGIPPFGSRWRVILNKESWSQALKRIYYKFPNEKFIGLTEVGGRKQWLIRDPELVRQITVRDFGHFVNRIDSVHSATDPLIGHELTNLKTTDWRQMRTILTPMLSAQRLKRIAIPALNESKIELVTFLKNEIKITKDEVLSVNMMDLMTRSGVDSFCLTALSLKTNSLHRNGENYGFYDYTQSYFRHSDSVSPLMYQMILKFPRVMRFVFGKTVTNPADNTFFIKSCQNIADKRIENKFERQDYLDLLQKMRDEANGTIVRENGKQYSDIDIIAQVFEFYESVILENNLLSTFIVQRLAENPNIQQRLYEEVKDFQRNLNGEAVTHETLNQMKYMDMIVCEALRMCPVAPELKRRATKPYSFETNDGKMVPIQSGDAIWIPTFILQNDPMYYPHPDVFDPERFNDKSAQIPGTYGPYGMGPRDCIGCQYATNEAKITFYYLLLDFIIETDDQKSEYNVQLKRRN